MTQLAARVDDALAREVDRLVAEGAFESRSDAVRRGLAELVKRHRRTHASQQAAEEYRHRPQSPAEVEAAVDAGARMNRLLY